MRKILQSIKFKYVLLALVGIFILMQAIRIDKSSPEHQAKDDILVATKASPEVVTLMHAACYDCHSYETKYPWYSDVAPISWWTKDHVNDGRRHVNFNDWTHFSFKRQQKKLHECIEELKQGEMPLSSYTWIHKDAKLNEAQTKVLLDWFNSQLATN